MRGVSNPFLALPTNRAAKPGVHRSGNGPYLNVAACACNQVGRASGRRPRYQEPHFRLGLGRDGGSRKAGGVVRSSISSSVLAEPTLAVSAGRFHFCSTSLDRKRVV